MNLVISYFHLSYKIFHLFPFTNLCYLIIWYFSHHFNFDNYSLLATLYDSSFFFFVFNIFDNYMVKSSHLHYKHTCTFIYPITRTYVCTMYIHIHSHVLAFMETKIEFIFQLYAVAYTEIKYNIKRVIAQYEKGPLDV